MELKLKCDIDEYLSVAISSMCLKYHDDDERVTRELSTVPLSTPKAVQLFDDNNDAYITCR